MRKKKSIIVVFIVMNVNSKRANGGSKAYLQRLVKGQF